MPQIRPDRRHIDAEANPDAERAAADAAAAYLDVRLRLARALLTIERGRTFHLSACSSVVQYAVRLGIPAVEARMLVDLGRALEAPPESAADPSAEPARTIEERVRSGQIPVENAVLLGRILAKPGLARPDEDWVRKAETLRTFELRKQVHARIEEAAQGVVPLVSVTVHITERTREDFHRARVLVSREAAVHVTEGQAFSRIVQFYLDEHDEKRRGAGTRRLGPTDAAPGTQCTSRHIPGDARRIVQARSGDRCEVPGCALDTFLEFAHIRSHSSGGSREADNLVRLCHVHHTQFDADCLLFSGWRDGRPVFRNVQGEELTSGTAIGAKPRERTDDLATAVAERRDWAAQVSERPPPEWVASDQEYVPTESPGSDLAHPWLRARCAGASPRGNEADLPTTSVSPRCRHSWSLRPAAN